jgi:hypothetical protein
MNCHHYSELIDRLATSDLDPREHAELFAHLEECPECAEEFELVRRLADEDVYPDPSEIELARMRRSVMSEISAESRRDWRPLMKWGAAAAMAVVVFGGGFGIGRRSSDTPEPARAIAANPKPASRPASMAEEIQLVAARNQDIEDVERSPFTYSNVQVSEVAPGTVQLRFDVSRHMEMTVPKSHPLVGEVLVQSLIEPASIGTKLKVISAADDVVQPKVREALILTMLEDESVAVRLKAQQKLIEHPRDGEIEKALLKVLADDESVQMRLVAIDYLTQNKVAPRLLRDALESSEPEGKSALYLRARDYIQN